MIPEGTYRYDVLPVRGILKTGISFRVILRMWISDQGDFPGYGFRIRKIQQWRVSHPGDIMRVLDKEERVWHRFMISR